MTLEGVVENKPYKFTYNVVGAGVWTADSERMSISLTNMKSIPKSLSLAGVNIPPELAVSLSGQPLPSLATRIQRACQKSMSCSQLPLMWSC